MVHDIRIALGSVAPIPLRCIRTERALNGKSVEPAALAVAKEILAGEISPIDDMRSTAHYRSRVAQNLLEDFLQEAASRR
jgi:xanthine dehydrogenase iron-sulfur cluster and FAD-binding subunit A